MTSLIVASSAVRSLTDRLAPVLFALLTTNILVEKLAERRVISESFALEFALFVGIWWACDALLTRGPLFLLRHSMGSLLTLIVAVAVCNAWLQLYSFLAEATCCAVLYFAMRTILYRISAAFSAKAVSRYGKGL